jgi:hypothetical protein
LELKVGVSFSSNHRPPADSITLDQCSEGTCIGCVLNEVPFCPFHLVALEQQAHGGGLGVHIAQHLRQPIVQLARDALALFLALLGKAVVDLFFFGSRDLLNGSLVDVRKCC